MRDIGQKAAARVLMSAMLILLVVGAARGQAFLVESASIEEGAAGVGLTDTLALSFTKQLPFSSQFAEGVRWWPQERVFRSYTFLDADRRNPLFALEHEPDTDYSVLVCGIRAADGSTLEVPFALSYTTAAQHGTQRIEGQVTERQRGASNAMSQKSTSAAQGSEPSLRSKLEQLTRAALPELDVASLARRAATEAEARMAASPGYAAIFLLGAYALEEEAWDVRSIAVTDASGRFSFEHVRPGTYYPVAVAFEEGGASATSAFGFYDPDGDLQPDPITVGAGSHVAPLTLFPYEHTLLQEALPLATRRARAVAEDARLVGFSAAPVNRAGRAATWHLTFVAASTGEATSVRVTPAHVEAKARVATEAERLAPGLPSDTLAVGSDSALAVAWQAAGAAYEAAHPGVEAYALLEGRSLNDRALWVVSFFGASDGSSANVLVDMQTGALVEHHGVAIGGRDIPEAARLEVYPNPVRGRATVTMTGRALNAEVVVYDALGRSVATLYEGPLLNESVQVTLPAGTWPAGSYYVTARAGQHTRLVRPVVVL